jgi:hypothetical protein
MPKSLWTESTRQEVVGRINRLTPDSKPLWGKMDAAGMLAHLLDWMRMAKGELPIRQRNLVIRHPPLKQFVIYWMPFPKGVPTAPELISRTSSDFAADVALLCSHVQSYGAMAEREDWPIHPAFGKMSHRAWGVLGYRHTDHHLRQFRV